MDKISSTWLQLSENKENQNHLSNLQVSPLIKRRIILTELTDFSSSSQSQDSDVDFNLASLTKQRKKYAFKRFLLGILNHRKARDLEESKVQICQEHLCFKIFQAWKRYHHQSRLSKLQLEMFSETQAYNLKRKCFIEWISIIRKNKSQKLQRQRQVFQAFKLVCSLQLSVRIKRLRVQGFISNAREAQFIKCLKEEKNEQMEMMNNAQLHWIRSTKIKTFRQLYKCSKNSSRDRIRYQKYQLAFLFRKKTLMQRCFGVLQQMN